MPTDEAILERDENMLTEAERFRMFPGGQVLWPPKDKRGEK